MGPELLPAVLLLLLLRPLRCEFQLDEFVRSGRGRVGDRSRADAPGGGLVGDHESRLKRDDGGDSGLACCP